MSTIRFLASHGIAKGAMTLIDAFRAETLEHAMRKAVEASGGSAANTTVGVRLAWWPCRLHRQSA